MTYNRQTTKVMSASERLDRDSDNNPWDHPTHTSVIKLVVSMGCGAYRDMYGELDCEHGFGWDCEGCPADYNCEHRGVVHTSESNRLEAQVARTLAQAKAYASVHSNTTKGSGNRLTSIRRLYAKLDNSQRSEFRTMCEESIEDDAIKSIINEAIRTSKASDGHGLEITKELIRHLQSNGMNVDEAKAHLNESTHLVIYMDDPVDQNSEPMIVAAPSASPWFFLWSFKTKGLAKIWCNKMKLESEVL